MTQQYCLQLSHLLPHSKLFSRTCVKKTWHLSVEFYLVSLSLFAWFIFVIFSVSKMWKPVTELVVHFDTTAWCLFLLTRACHFEHFAIWLLQFIFFRHEIVSCSKFCLRGHTVQPLASMAVMVIYHQVTGLFQSYPTLPSVGEGGVLRQGHEWLILHTSQGLMARQGTGHLILHTSQDLTCDVSMPCLYSMRFSSVCHTCWMTRMSYICQHLSGHFTVQALAVFPWGWPEFSIPRQCVYNCYII